MTTKAPSSVQDLQKHLQNTKLVTVKDKNGEEFVFKILPVSMAKWDHDENMWQTVAEDPKVYQDVVKKAVEGPTDAVVRRVIMSACQEPRVSQVADKDAVLLEDLMRHDILIINLYAEIVDHSFSGILKTEATDARSGSPGNS